MNIGLLGVAINNRNMGCVALTVSILNLLESISIDADKDIHFVVFDEFPDIAKTKYLFDQLHIKEGRYTLAKEGRYGSIKRIFWHAADNLKQIHALKKCNIVIDLTQGDSFTDIYGQRRFLNYTRMKKLVLNLGIPLVLGPQTYGPFNNEANRVFAQKVIKRADLVITRDEKSFYYLKNELNINNVELTTDLAFALPFKKETGESKKIRLGVNISGLLVKDKVEFTKTEFSLTTDYDKCMIEIITWALEQEQYEVHIIPHVVEDYEASKKLLSTFLNDVVIHDVFANPIDVKNYIANMDIFVGARMHATIAAFSSGVATIPVAYSRKFTGLFNTLNYPYVVDMQELETNRAIEMIKDYILQKDELKIKSQESLVEVHRLCEKNRKILKEYIKNK